MLAKARKRRSRRTQDRTSRGCSQGSVGLRWCHSITLVGLGLCVMGAALMAVASKSGCSSVTNGKVRVHPVRTLQHDSSLEQLMRRNMTDCALSVAENRALDTSSIYSMMQEIIPMAAATLATERGRADRHLRSASEQACVDRCIENGLLKCIMAMPEVQNQMDCVLPGFMDRWCGCYDSFIYCSVGCFPEREELRAYVDSLGSCLGMREHVSSIVADMLCDDLVAGQAIGATITSVGAAAVVSSQAAVAMFPATDSSPSSTGTVSKGGHSTRTSPVGGSGGETARCGPLGRVDTGRGDSGRVSHIGKFGGTRPPGGGFGESETKPVSGWEGSANARTPEASQQRDARAWEPPPSDDKGGSHTGLSAATEARVGHQADAAFINDKRHLNGQSRGHINGQGDSGNSRNTNYDGNGNGSHSDNGNNTPSPPGDAMTNGTRAGFRKYWKHVFDAQEDWSDIFGYALHVALIGMVVGQQASTAYSGFSGGFYWTMGGIPIGFLKDGAVGLAKATSSGNVNSIESMEWVGSSPTAAPTISMNVPGYAFFTYLVILTLLFTTLALLAVLAWRKAVTSFAVAAQAAALLKIPNARKLSAKIIFRTWQTTLILQVGAAVTQLGMPNGGGFLLFIALLWFFGYCFGVFVVVAHLVSKGLSAFWDVGVVHADLVTPLQVPAASLDTKPAVLTLGGVASPTSTIAASTPHTPAASPLNVAAASAAATTDADDDVDEEMGLESVESFDEASLRLQNPLATPSAQTPSLASVNNSDGSTGPTLPSLGGPGSAMANDQQEPVTPVTSTVTIGGHVHWKATLTAWWAHVRSGNAWKKLKAAHGKDMFRPFAAHSDFHAVKSLGHMAGLLGPKSNELATSQAPPTPVELYGSPDGVAQACRTGKTVLAFDKVEEFVPSWFEVVDGFVDTYSVSKSYFAIVDLGAALLLALCAAAFTQAKVVALMALLFVTVRRQVRQLHRSAPSLPPSHWAFEYSQTAQGYLIRAVRPKASLSANVLAVCLSYTKIVATTLAFFQLLAGTSGFKDFMAVLLIIVQGSVSLLLVVKKIRQLVTRWRQIKVWVLGTSIGAKLCCCIKANTSEEKYKAAADGAGSIATTPTRMVVPSPAHAQTQQPRPEELPRPQSLSQQPQQGTLQASPAIQTTAEHEASFASGVPGTPTVSPMVNAADDHFDQGLGRCL